MLFKTLASIYRVSFIGVMCVASSPLFAATQIDLSTSPLVLPVTPTITAAIGNQPAPINVISRHTDNNQVTHVRIQQMYADYPVWGTESVVHIPKTVSFAMTTNNSFASSLRSNPTVPKNGFFYADINKDLVNADPKKFDNDTSKARAVSFLKQTLDQTYQDRRFSYSDEDVKVMVYIDDASKAHTAFLVSVLATTEDQLPKRPTAIIDAQDNTIYKQWNDVKTLDVLPAQVSGYGGNPIVGKIEYGKDKPALQVSRNAENSLCYLSNDDLEVLKKTDMQPEIPGKAISFNCTKQDESKTTYLEPEGGYLGQFNGGYSPINDAFHEGMVIKKLYQDWYGITVLTKRDKVTPLLLSLNLLYLHKTKDSDGTYENAFWYSRTQKMYFGLGGEELYPLVALDVAAHEISHGFTDQHSNLVYMDQSGALNESFSDMAAVAASYYDSNEKSANWMIGGEVMKENTGKNKDDYVAIRFINNPGHDGASIDNVSKYSALTARCKAESARDPDRYQSCIVHLASGVFNKVFYNLATTPGWNPKTAFAVMIKANEDYWTPTSNYQAAACGVKKALADTTTLTVDHEVASKTLDRIFADVGISVASCR